MRSFKVQDSTLLKVVDSVLTIESYDNRDGYDATFVDKDIALSLPTPGKHKSDLAHLVSNARKAGQDLSELKYTHFSVRQLKSRRMPLYSAVNIDGKSTVKVERTDVWRRDPRIDLKFQNHRDAYGNANEGLFSRGHITRREDPNWGSKKTAIQADMDTFHVTNAAPQQQSFNAGIWLDLESYILDNTDDADLRVSVLSGAIFEDSDPDYFGIKVPLSFYKIVAFRHAETKQLTTIGYKRSQGSFLATAKKKRFVFGDFDDTQVPISSLARDTGLGLKDWQKFDVMSAADVQLEVRLRHPSDLFIR